MHATDTKEKIYLRVAYHMKHTRSNRKKNEQQKYNQIFYSEINRDGKKVSFPLDERTAVAGRKLRREIDR